jgi:Uma2 family endonuclease
MPSTLTEPPRVDETTVRPASFDEFLALPEGTPAQYVDGQIYTSPAPRPCHQDVLQNLYSALRAYAAEQAGKPASPRSTCSWRPSGPSNPTCSTSRPSAATGSASGASRGGRRSSPSTAYLDVSVKRRAYEESDVEELWTLDPGARSVMVLTRERPGRTGLARTAYVYESGPVASAALPGFEVEAASLFTRP